MCSNIVMKLVACAQGSSRLRGGDFLTTAEKSSTGNSGPSGDSMRKSGAKDLLVARWGLHLWLSGVAVIFLMACTTITRSAVSPDSLHIRLEVVQRQVGAAWHPVAILEIQNVSEHTVAFSRTFGVTNQPWLSFRIETTEGDAVYYPSEIDVFGELPDYICLKRGETLSWELDLLKWRVLFGGEAWEGFYSFDLEPGRYRIQARYTDGSTHRPARCATLDGTVFSQWVEFDVVAQSAEAPQSYQLSRAIHENVLSVILRSRGRRARSGPALKGVRSFDD